MTCKLQAYISVYQEGLETEFCVSSYNSDVFKMIEERAADERVKKIFRTVVLKIDLQDTSGTVQTARVVFS